MPQAVCYSPDGLAGAEQRDEAVARQRREYRSRVGCINFFQPSFKLKSKARDGARVKKVYYTPATPCERLVAHNAVAAAIKAKLTAQFMRLDPVQLLEEIRLAQQTLSDVAAHGPTPQPAAPIPSDIEVFVTSLSSAWKEGEVRPTHRKRAHATHS